MKNTLFIKFNYFFTPLALLVCSSSILFSSYYKSLCLLIFILLIAIWTINLFKPVRFSLSLLFILIPILAIRTEIFKQNLQIPDKYLNRTFTYQAKVLTNPELKNNSYHFLAKLKNINQKIQVSYKHKFIKFNYGDLIELTGKITLPELPRNPGQGNYALYLQSNGISGTMRVNSVKILKSRLGNPLKAAAYALHKKIQNLHKACLESSYADLLMSLVIGDQGIELTKETESRFKYLGLTHLLVVSGAQVALLSGIIYQCLLLIGLRPFINFIFISFINILFYFLTGGGAAILRAIIMCELTYGIALFQRRTSSLHILSLTAIVMLLWQPMSLFNSGFQLSFLATLSLIYGARIITQSLPDKWPGWLKTLSGITIAPWLFTTPVLWYSFKSISLVSLLSNLLIVPWIEFVVILGAAATAIGVLFKPLTLIIDQAIWLLLIVLEFTTKNLSKIPFGSIYLKSPPLFLLITIMVLGLGLFYFLERKNFSLLKKTLLVLLIALILYTGTSLLPGKTYRITFLDVGQGDAAVIETPDNQVLLIDGGPEIRDFHTNKIIWNAGERVIKPYLQSRGLNKIDILEASHQHADHTAGIPALISCFRIGTFMHNGNLKNASSLFMLAQKKKIPILAIKNCSEYKLSRKNKISMLRLPFENSPKQLGDQEENNQSLVTRVLLDKLTILFTGDIEKEGEAWLVENFPNYLSAQILKVAHHGSKTSSSLAFLTKVKPKAAIISVGKRNKFQHPSIITINKLGELHIPVYRTDKLGAIIISYQNKKAIIKSFFKRKKLQSIKIINK